jgi:hypothetical protein
MDEPSGDGIGHDVSELLDDGLWGAKLNTRGGQVVPKSPIPVTQDFDSESQSPVKVTQEVRNAATAIGDNQVHVVGHEHDGMQKDAIALAIDSQQILA